MAVTSSLLGRRYDDRSPAAGETQRGFRLDPSIVSLEMRAAALFAFVLQ
jgi:hypothetical protein